MITLLTDFGTADGYVAEMKGILWSRFPEARVMDACHEIPPQNIRSGAWVLAQYAHDFPPETVHVAVVDPGVGTRRDGLVLRCNQQWFIAPDNGLLSLVLRDQPEARARALRDLSIFGPTISPTFHGRDVFIVAAAWLAEARKRPEEFATPVALPDPKPWSQADTVSEQVRGAVLHVDRFGNLISNIRLRDIDKLPGPFYTVRVGDLKVSLSRAAYGHHPEGMLIALINSSGHLELAVVNGSAQRKTDWAQGTSITVLSRTTEDL